MEAILPKTLYSAERILKGLFGGLLSVSFSVLESHVLAENVAAKLQADRKEMILFTSGSTYKLRIRIAWSSVEQGAHSNNKNASLQKVFLLICHLKFMKISPVKNV